MNANNTNKLDAWHQPGGRQQGAPSISPKLSGICVHLRSFADKPLFPGLCLVGLLALAGCDDPASSQSGPTPPPFVKTVAVAQTAASRLGLSGTVRARVESPLSFQVAGRIASRQVDAGQSVAKGQVLFELDQRDLEQSVSSAQADLAGADAAVATAQADLARQRQMREKRFTSAQELERAELNLRETQTRRDAAAARVAQARNALGYAHLQAPAAGVLIDVTGESGQVVAAGQSVATLAQSGQREIEVWFPDGVTPPELGETVQADGTAVPLKLRETAGAVDPQGRTRRARYTVLGKQDALVLGTVQRARFGGQDGPATDFTVPIAAIDERAQGPRVWRFQEGRVAPVPVTVQAVDVESARIRGPLTAGERIVALGTHLLTEGMQVRELQR
jgi:RND family efflux transporter MFP subunit